MSNLSESIAELKTIMGQCEAELQSLQSGKKASAPRVRASLQKIKALSHSMRSSVMEFTKELPTKPRAKKPEPEPVVHAPTAAAVLAEDLEAAATPVKKARAPRKKPIKKEMTE